MKPYCIWNITKWRHIYYEHKYNNSNWQLLLTVRTNHKHISVCFPLNFSTLHTNDWGSRSNKCKCRMQCQTFGLKFTQQRGISQCWGCGVSVEVRALSSITDGRMDLLDRFPSSGLGWYGFVEDQWVMGSDVTDRPCRVLGLIHTSVHRGVQYNASVL